MERLQQEAEAQRQARQELENAIQAERNGFSARQLEREREVAAATAELEDELKECRRQLEELSAGLSQAQRDGVAQRCAERVAARPLQPLGRRRQGWAAERAVSAAAATGQADRGQ
eukprot:SAG11_NODE_3978_length_2125_cov_1.100691_1_plen_115_part_10